LENSKFRGIFCRFFLCFGVFLGRGCALLVYLRFDKSPSQGSAELQLARLGAWLCITVPLVWYLVSAEVIKGFDPGGWGGALWIVLGFPISVSPIATIIGAIVGDLLFRLYRKRVNKLARG
jgi:uncharacterized membrane protein